jgi:hypothetical protein
MFLTISLFRFIANSKLLFSKVTFNEDRNGKSEPTFDMFLVNFRTDRGSVITAINEDLECRHL